LLKNFSVKKFKKYCVGNFSVNRYKTIALKIQKLCVKKFSAKNITVGRPRGHIRTGQKYE